MFSEDVGDGASANLMTQIGQCAADPRVSPRGIDLRHAQNEIPDCLHDAGPPRTAVIRKNWDQTQRMGHAIANEYS
jgi:hypothetical protein